MHCVTNMRAEAIVYHEQAFKPTLEASNCKHSHFVGNIFCVCKYTFTI